MRISREQMFMNMAEVTAQRATCFRAGVGALIVRANDVVSHGYNGPASGEPHCYGSACEKSPTGGCTRALHAERNAIERALAKSGRDLGGCTLFTTYGPCMDCADRILLAYIGTIYYRYTYRLQHEAVDKLMGHGVNVFRITPSGIVVSERTKEIINAPSHA